MAMKGYSADFDENCAAARLEGVDASYKDLSEVCGRIKGKDALWAIDFLARAAKAEIPVLYKRHNKKLGHRRELGGKKGRYPKKAAGIVLKVLRSAIANGMVRGLGEEFSIATATANKKHSFPRMAPKGRSARSYYELARIEIILRSKSEVPKGVEVTPPAKEELKAEKKAEEKKPEHKAPESAEFAQKKEESRLPHHPAEEEHKHEHEKEQDSEHAHHDRFAYEHGKGKKTVVKER